MFKHIGYALSAILLVIMFSNPLQAQTLVWETNFGGLLNEMGNSCAVLPDSSIVILGTTYSFGSGMADIYLVKTDYLGNPVWSREYGSDSTEFGNDVQVTSDGGFIIVGNTAINADAKDVYLVKVDSSGLVEWETTIGGTGSDYGQSVRQTSDNGYVITGTTNSMGNGYNDIYIIKTDSLGELEWQKTYGGAGGESGCAGRQTADSGYVLIGSTGSYGVGYSSIYVIRTDKNGDSLWTKTYGGDRADFGYSVEVTADGGFIFVGATASFGNGESDAYLIKTDPSGNVEWDYTYGGSAEDRGYQVKELRSGNFILTGKTESYSSSIDVYLVMTNPIGVPLWSSYFGGTQSDEALAIAIDANEDIIVAGKSYSYTSGGSDIYLIKVLGDHATDVNELIAVDLLPEGFELYQNYPNPFNMSTSIEYSIPRRADVSLTVYNVLGQTVSYWSASSLPAGSYRYEWDGTNENGSEVASGVYLYRLQYGNFARTKKMLLLK